MSIDRLKQELARIGDDAPVVEVAPDTWSRAARARTRGRVLTLAAAAAAVALVAGLVAWLPQRLEVPVAAGADSAVPDHVWSAPARMAEREGDGATWASDLETDLAVGPVAVAYVMGEGLPVLVDADDGDYHLLDLPDFVGNDEFLALMTGYVSELPLALSPDGRRLAYGFATIGPEAASEPVPSGVRVVDLTTGDVREVALPGGEGVLVDGFSWSPDGRWLAWHGRELASWTQFSVGGAAPVTGLIGPDGDTSVPLPLMDRSAQVSYAPADDGTVAVVGDSLMLLVDGASVERVPLRPEAGFSVGAAFVDGVLQDVRINDDRGYSVHLVSGRERLAFPNSGLDDRDVRPLGWVGERHLVAEVSLPDADRVGGRDSELAVIGVGDEPSYDVVGEVDADVPPLSVASDLMTLEQPTVARPEPDWPWSPLRWLVTTGLIGMAVLFVLGLVVARQRRSAR